MLPLGNSEMFKCTLFVIVFRPLPKLDPSMVGVTSLDLFLLDRRNSVMVTRLNIIILRWQRSLVVFTFLNIFQADITTEASNLRGNITDINEVLIVAEQFLQKLRTISVEVSRKLKYPLFQRKAIICLQREKSLLAN